MDRRSNHSPKNCSGTKHFNVIRAYAPRVGFEEHIKVKFWEDLEGLIQDIPLGENIFLEWGLNRHVGSGSCNF